MKARRGRALRRRYGHAKRPSVARTKLAVEAGFELVGQGLASTKERMTHALRDLGRIEKRVNWLLAHRESKT